MYHAWEKSVHFRCQSHLSSKTHLKDEVVSSRAPAVPRAWRVDPVGLPELLDLRPPRPLPLARLDRLELVKVRRGSLLV